MHREVLYSGMVLRAERVVRHGVLLGSFRFQRGSKIPCGKDNTGFGLDMPFVDGVLVIAVEGIIPNLSYDCNKN